MTLFGGGGGVGRSGEVAPALGDKKAQNRVICGSTCRNPLHAATAAECVRRGKAGY